MKPLTTILQLDRFDPVAIMRALGLEGEAPVVLLDSAGGSAALARRHYLVWRPALRIRAKDGRVRQTGALPGANGAPADRRVAATDEQPDAVAKAGPDADRRDPFDAVRAAAAAAQALLTGAPFPEARSLFGLVCYDAVRYLEDLPDGTRDDLRLPDIDLFLPTRVVRYDIESGAAEVICWPLAEAAAAGAAPAGRTPPEAADAAAEAAAPAEAAVQAEAAAADLDRIAAVLAAGPQTGLDPPDGSEIPVYRSNFARVHYENVVGRTREYVFAGDIFQANLSQRLELCYALPSLRLYDTLRRVNPSPFAGYLAFGDYELISSSPERLVELDQDGWAQTRPIAGTRPRGQHDEAALDDGEMTEELNLDPKDRAEHVMLVDLERNDLGKVCAYGTVRVNELMVNEYYSHVIHIVSNVRGRLHEARDGVDLLKGMFPGGTITGCPKVRCMEIIDELETVRRGPYTGSFGWLSLDTLDMNIIIRTLVRVGDRLFLQVGGGIVADSVPEKEFFETLHKARGMLRAVAASIVER
jgi:anthranilate/para-aminobenzoate synthase component I